MGMKTVYKPVLAETDSVETGRTKMNTWINNRLFGQLDK